MFDAAIEAMLGHRADTAGLLATAMATRPDDAFGHALAGLSACLLARRETLEAARGHLALARQATADARGAAFRAALVAWAGQGEMKAAALILEARLRADPLDAAALKLSQGIRFMLGDAAGMRLAIEQALPAWNPTMSLHGFVLGCHAFALEETGDRRAAERVGREAVALRPDDAWGAHAVAHVLEGEGRAREGLAWLGAAERRLHYSPFARHLFWHGALFHLHLGQGEAAMAVYDERVRAERSEDYRDVANAASLLWRLQAQGVPVGARWEELADIAESRIGDHSLAFADLHHVLSLAACGRHGALAAFLAGLRGRALRDIDTQARVFATAGLTAARGIAAAVGGEATEAADLLGAVRRDLPLLGGSHAQRDLIERIGIAANLEAGRRRAGAELLAERATRRAPGAWEAAQVGAIGPRGFLPPAPTLEEAAAWR
jgi:tetratricopeptide (TPR) repeat protein